MSLVFEIDKEGQNCLNLGEEFVAQEGSFILSRVQNSTVNVYSSEGYERYRFTCRCTPTKWNGEGDNCSECDNKIPKKILDLAAILNLE